MRTFNYLGMCMPMYLRVYICVCINFIKMIPFDNISILNPRKSNLFLKLQLYLIYIPLKEERKDKRSFQSEGTTQNKADV